MTGDSGRFAKGVPTVLVVEDDLRTRTAVKWFFAEIGYGVREADDGGAALELVEKADPDMILLDLNLPTMDGMEVLRTIRKTSSVPIIVVSAREDQSDRIEALEMGADDYMTKPISLEELEVRVRVVLRRVDPRRPADIISVGKLQIDRGAGTVLIGSARVGFSRKEFELLAVLASRPARVFSRDELLSEVWGSTDYWQGPATLKEHVRRVRQKLGDQVSSGCTIEAERGAGYRLVEYIDGGQRESDSASHV